MRSRLPACALAALSLILASARGGSAAGHAVGEIVPLVRAVDIHGREVNLGDLVAAKRVAVYFWDWRRATSLRGLNLLDALSSRYGDRGFEVVAIEGEGSPAATVAERVERLRSIGTGISFPVVPDPGGKIARQFRVDSTPQLFLLDGAGRVAFYLAGFGTEDEQAVADAVRDLVGETPPAPAPLVPARREPPPPAPQRPGGEPVASQEPPPAAPAPVRIPDPDPRENLLERFRYFGGYYFNRGEYARAEDNYLKYLALAPEDVQAWLRLGEAQARRGAYDEARESWERVLRLDPGNAEADAQIRKLIRGEY